MLRSGHAVRIYGVTCSMALFKALAARLGAGTVVDVAERHGGGVTLYHHKPGGAG